ncbi:hypothetical protein [Ascidiimonas aurantiaca]
MKIFITLISDFLMLGTYGQEASTFSFKEGMQYQSAFIENIG